jgi:hypothetical protein
MDSLIEECSLLGSQLAPTAIALVRYASSLGISSFTKKGQRHVAAPNFVTFEIHHQRARNLTISLRGNPIEFLSFPEMKAKKAQHGYSEVKVIDAGQLLAAANCIARARQVFDRGRTRVMKTPKLIEV